ncbi:MAG: metal ABC transporter permease [Porphyromonas sp.]|nr:metal ABC transporter permease [Porphyromonas sp.]
MDNILGLQFFQNALYASVLSAVVCGIVGAYIVVRRIVFVSGGITHASFGGLGLGLYLGINPLLTAGITAILAALGIGHLGRFANMREDSAIASVWALGMALGVLFMSLTPGYTAGLSSYLFGNILLVSRADLWALLLLALCLVATFTLGYRQILYCTFDPDFAKTKGLPVGLIHLALLVLVSIAMVLSIRLVGIMLLMSLLTLPQTIMGLFTSRFSYIMLGSVALCLVANVLGLFLSTYWLSIPTGVMIVLLLFVMLGLARLVKALGL